MNERSFVATLHYTDVETEAQGGKQVCFGSPKVAEAELDQTPDAKCWAPFPWPHEPEPGTSPSLQSGAPQGRSLTSQGEVQKLKARKLAPHPVSVPGALPS